MKLYRYSYKTPNFESFNKMTEELTTFLYSDFSDEWPETLQTILKYQAENGGFAYVDDWHIPSDSRVEYCYKPTYLCTAILMKAALVNILPKEDWPALKNAMFMSTQRNFQGHGFDADDGLEEAVNIFCHGMADKFLEDHPDLCPEFTSLYRESVEYLRARE